MIISENGRICEKCGLQEAVVLCDGCSRALCEKCRIFDLWSYGCGHIDPKVFCNDCHDSLEKNPWGGKRPE